jgi:hypothetical protein
VIAGEEGSDKVVPPVSSEEKEKEKKRKGRGTGGNRLAGLLLGWFGPRVGPVGLMPSSSLLFFLFVLNLSHFPFLLFFYIFSKLISNKVKPMSKIF